LGRILFYKREEQFLKTTPRYLGRLGGGPNKKGWLWWRETAQIFGGLQGN